MPLQPVDYASRPNRFLRLIVALILVSAVGLAAFSFSKWWQTREQLQRVITPTNAPSVQVPIEPVPAPENAASKYRIKVSTNIVVRTNVGARAAATEPTSDATQTNAAAVATDGFPELKLQSIIYRLNKPAAVVNGEMVYVGDTIKGARVLSIDRQTVVVEWKGSTNMLQLPRL